MTPASLQISDLARWPDPQDATVFLDFDGTLIDLADTPSGITIPADLPPLLANLSRRSNTCIVSGRGVRDVADHLPDFSGDIYGGHGAQSRVNGQVYDHPLAGTPHIRDYQQAITTFAADHHGALAEMKDAGVVLHYRKAPTLEAEARAFAENLIAGNPDVVAHPAKMAIEIKPTDVNKGGVVKGLLTPARTPIFCGDDATDEAAFAVINDAGGISVKVGEGSTIARHRVPEPTAMRNMLWDWLKENDV